jgi:hypothetical protein
MKNASFLQVNEIEERERAHVRDGGAPRVFYHPGFSANVVVSGSTFKRNGVPKGYELDVAAWEKVGREGAAPLKRKVALTLVTTQPIEPVAEPQMDPELEEALAELRDAQAGTDGGYDAPARPKRRKSG